jgi:hypothetical protein
MQGLLLVDLSSGALLLGADLRDDLGQLLRVLWRELNPCDTDARRLVVRPCGKRPASNVPHIDGCSARCVQHQYSQKGDLPDSGLVEPGVPLPAAGLTPMLITAFSLRQYLTKQMIAITNNTNA